jgi:tripartite-type tricarboxylate transporter receptor subunit TctC
MIDAFARMLLGAAATACFLVPPPQAQAQAQQYPARPVKVVVGFAAGSGPDVLARTVAQQLASDLGHQFYVENRTGANGTIATK